MNINDILYKLADGTATEVEKENFSKQIQSLSVQEYHQLLLEYESIIAKTDTNGAVDEYLLKTIHQQINTHAITDAKRTKAFLINPKWIVAAAVIAVIAGSWWFYTQQPAVQQKDIAVAPKTNQIIPGGNKAVLTLADGSQVILDSAGNGAIATQGNVKIIKLADGKLSYSKEGATNEVVYNTISTPKGGKYDITLSDGSKVWLNAASSLTYPNAFVGNERKVTLRGEGYFEVAHNAAKPFHVMVNDIDVAVLGTHFNINSYEGEPALRTTLLEGKVVVKKGTQQATLKPGQQAEITNNININNDVDIEEVIAWKNGVFVFNNTNIETILRQVARWYDVDVVYENKTNETFSGVIPRSENISKLLKILEATGKVDFKINGKQIIVKTKK